MFTLGVLAALDVVHGEARDGLEHLGDALAELLLVREVDLDLLVKALPGL